MSANLLTLESAGAASALPTAAQAGTQAAPVAAAADSERPGYLPEKFWDPEGKKVRLDVMSKSYGELERKLSSMMPGPQAPDFDKALRKALGVPEAPDAYRIELKDDLLQVDPEVNKRLHAAGFSPAQAQLVYDLAIERMVPLVREYAEVYRSEMTQTKLIEEFGGDTAWSTLAPQLASWGQANLPSSVYDALAATPEGVRALHKLMNSGEPNLRGATAAASGPADEAELRKLMADKRYWRDHDPELVRIVSEGFKRLYPDRD
ncbi:MAG: hypothetical protein ING44_13755 [Telmatospirillum sp.]|nr:hypothetical protein [Telmatospirillum sp.]